MLRHLAACLCAIALLAAPASAQAPSVLQAFDGFTAGTPLGGLTMGRDGRLYGTTSTGKYGGTIFRLATDGSGFEILHNFGDGSVTDDGLSPGFGALVEDTAGVFYGTTSGGGAFGGGALYRLDVRGTTPVVDIVYSFDGNAATPEAGVIVGSDGWLYGTAGTGSITNGVVYRVTRDGSTLEELHAFTGTDGSDPRGTLIEGSDGVLYGTTRLGGALGAGTVFRIGRDGSGFTTLADLDGYPQVGVTEAPGPDGTPHLFGVEYSSTDQTREFGALFRLRPDGTEFTRLRQFYGGDGAHPQTPLLLGHDGHLYGSAFDSGRGCSAIIHCGVVYRIGEIDDRPWTIHLFTGANGGGPSGALVQGPDGALYGVAANGGAPGTPAGAGVVFTVPRAASTPVEFLGPATATEGNQVSYTLALENTSGVALYSNTVSFTFSAGLTFDQESSDNWFCAVTDTHGYCQWNSILYPGERSDTHALTFTVSPPYAQQCGLGSSPCVLASAVLQYSGARVDISTPVSTYVNGFLNAPPDAQPDAAGASGTVPVRIRVLANDSDADGDQLTVSGIPRAPARGTAVVNADGSITYTALAPLTAPDTFWYQITDARGATATAVVTVTPVATPPLVSLNPLVDIGSVAIGDLAAGRAWVLGPTPLTGTVTFEALSPAEVATALAGTAYDVTRATSDPNAFRGSSWMSLLTPPYEYAGMVTLYHRGTGQPGDVSVARAVITADGSGATPPTTTVIVVASAAAPAQASRRAIADVATTAPQGPPVAIDVLANDVLQRPKAAHYIQMVSSCANIGAFVFDGANCDGGLGLGHIAFPGMTDPAQVITFTPDPGAANGATTFSYAFAEEEACISDPACLPINPMYFAPVTVTYQAGTPIDLQLSIALTTPAVVAGQPVAGTLSVTNAGSSTASGVVLRGLDALTSFQNLVLGPSRGTCQPWTSGNPVTCDLGAIDPTQIVTIAFSATSHEGLIQAGQPSQTLTIGANVLGVEPDPSPSNNTVSTGITIIRPVVPPAADVSVLISATPATVNVGQPVTLSVTVFNSGPDAASNVRLSGFNFLAGVGFSGSTFPPNWTCAPLVNGVPLSCQVARLAPGTSTVFTVTATATSGVFTGGSGPATLIVDASIAADEPDAQTQNNIASALVSVARPPATLGINATASPTLVSVGGTATYQIDVVNTGVTDATGIRVVVDMPVEIGVVSLDSLPGLSGCSFSAGLTQAGTPDVTLTCSLAPLPVNGTHVLSFTGKLLTAPTGGAISFPVVVYANNCVATSPLTGTQCAVANVQTTQLVTTMQAELLVESPVPPATAVVGSAVTLVTRVTNTGAAPARQTRVTLQFPTELAGTQALSIFGPLTGCSYRPNLPAPGVFIDCTLGTVAPGEIKEARFVTQVAAVPIAPAAPIVMRVGSVDCIDLSTAGGSQCDSVAAGPIVTRATLTATLTGGKSNGAPIQLGDLVNITGQLTNSNTTTARNVKATFILPASLGLTQITAQPFLSGCSFAPALSGGALGTPGVTMTCTLASIAPGASAVWTFAARALAVPASNDYQPRMEFGSIDCYDMSAGSNVCNAVTGSVPVTPMPSGSAAGGVITLNLSSGTFGSLQSLPTSSVPAPPGGVTFPYGAMAFDVYDVPVGGTITIGISTPTPVSGYWKLNANVWSRFGGGVSTTGGLTLTLTDGGPGDADGVANGVIVDPGALGVVVSAPPTASAGPDVVAEATGPVGAVVTLAGAGTDPAGSLLSFAWSGPCGSASTASASFTCPAGTSTMTLTVSNAEGLTSIDDVQVLVRDTIPPVVAITAPAQDAVYVLNQRVRAQYQCTDAGLGISSCAGTAANDSWLDTSTVGTRSFQATALDTAGNQTTVVRSYRVVFAPGGRCYLGDGHEILPPIDDDGRSVFPQGWPVFARFRVCDAGGTPVRTPPVVADFKLVQSVGRDGTRVLNDDVPSLLMPPVFQWEPILKSWVFVIDTRRLRGRTSYDFRITLTDGSTIPFRFSLR
ncbi:MAG: choice-of-anchor tandem repeat GloVer-containing protein [Vicinamibacterales bacterium]